MAVTVEETSLEAKRIKRYPFLVDLLIRLVKTKPLGTVGGVIFLILIVTGIFSESLAPYPANETHLADRLQPPSTQYLFGTDNLGRDLLSRIIFGARISMLVGVIASMIEVGLAAILGLISGYFGGKTDLIIQRFVDAWMCIPPLFIYLTVMSLVGPGLTQVIVVLGIATAFRVSRVVRSAVIGVKENVYVEAARAIGASNGRIILQHVLPNIMAPIIVLFTVGLGQMILQEAFLSFLGFGIPPPTPSWGGMLSGSGREYMLLAPWMAFWPGLALALVVYGANMLGDGVRDLLDPRLRGGLGRYGRKVTKLKK